MRATLARDGDGLPRVTPLPSQDSSLLSPLAIADCLIVRSPKSPAVVPGETVRVLPLDF